MGDPAGIGPEVTVKALTDKRLYRISRPLVIGDLSVIQNAMRLSELALQVNTVDDPHCGAYEFGVLDLIDLKNVDVSNLAHGTVAATTGRASFEYVEKAIKLAIAKETDAVVTGPIHKESIRLAGIPYAGHTEILANMTDTKGYAMMLAEGAFRVVHVSTHVSLREAVDRVKKQRVFEVIELAAVAAKKLGIEDPKIAVAGLNPHAGENGLFGSEEKQEILPAVEKARATGLNVEGPIPPDTVFPKMNGGQYDIVVTMYHDQGHIPTKLVGFHYDRATDTWSSMSGVNITLGLPIIRTSVDHGVAFDIAGEGKANPESMIQAIEMAVALT